MSLMAAVSIGVGFLVTGPVVFSEMGTYVAAVTVAFQYFLGFRVRDRTTALVASALLASSPLFSAAPATAVRDGLFVLFTIAALAAFAAGYELIAVIIASGATVMRPEGILLGAVLLGFTLTERRPGGVVGGVVYLLCTFLGLAGLVFIGHQPIPIPSVSLRLAPIASVFDVQTGIVALFIWAMLDDLGDAVRRARWKPVIVWSVLFLCVESLFHFSGFSFETGPFRPVLLLLAAGGISRLLPVIAGNFANPVTRYAVAVLFVGTLILARVRAEWPLIHSHMTVAAISKPAAGSTRSAHAMAAGRTVAGTSAYVPPGIPHHIIVVPSSAVREAVQTSAAAHAHAKTASAIVKPAVQAAPKRTVVASNPKDTDLIEVDATPRSKPGAPKSAPVLYFGSSSASLAARAVAAGVPLYTIRHGRAVARTVWAINWDLQHRPHVAAIAAAHPAKAIKTIATAAMPATHTTAPAPKPVALMHAAAAAGPAQRAAKRPIPVRAVVAVKPPAVRRVPAPLPVAAKPVVKHPAAAALSSLDAQAVSAGVAVYIVHRGRRIHRTDWAIRWDIAHKPHAAGAARVVAVPRKATVATARVAPSTHLPPPLRQVALERRIPAAAVVKPAAFHPPAVHTSVAIAPIAKYPSGRRGRATGATPAALSGRAPLAPRAVALSPLDATAASLGVATYVVRHGRRFPRTEWAIRWDIAHKPHPLAQAKPPAAAAAPEMPHGTTPPAASHGRKPLGHVARRAVKRRRKLIRKPRHRSIWAVRWARAHPKRR